MQLGCQIQPQGDRKNWIKCRLKVRKQFVSIEIYATSVYAGRAREEKRWYNPRQYNRLLFFRLNCKRLCFQIAKITMHFLSSSSHWLFIHFGSISKIDYAQWIPLPQKIFAKIVNRLYYDITWLDSKYLIYWVYFTTTKIKENMTDS